MARSRARLTLVVNRSRRPSHAEAVRAAWAGMYADSQRELKARGLQYQPPRTTFGDFTKGKSLSEVMGYSPPSEPSRGRRAKKQGA